MKLSKIQNFLKENNINYTIEIDKNGFAEIRIKDNKTIYTCISEISGNKWKSINGILMFGIKQDTHKLFNITLTSQKEVIARLEKNMKEEKV